MSDSNLKQPVTDPYDDPVGYLGAFGIAAVLIEVNQPDLAEAA